jgi:hypothetical protein
VPADTLIGYVRGADVSGAFLDSLVDMLGADGYQTIAGVVRVESGPALCAARNELCKVFMEKTTEPWLYLTDTDMVFHPSTVARLKQYASPRVVAGSLCFGWFSDARIAKPTLYGEGLEQILDWEPNSVVPVHATGAASLLIHRRIFESTPYPWWTQDPEGVWGEDQGFCSNIRAAGNAIVVDTGTPVLHDKRILVGPGDYEPERLRAAFAAEAVTATEVQ